MRRSAVSIRLDVDKRKYTFAHGKFRAFHLLLLLTHQPQTTTPESPLENALTVTFSSGSERWAELVPLTDSYMEAVVTDVPDDDSRGLFATVLPGHYMLCAGADGLATQCFPVEVQGHQTLAASPQVGIEVKGEVFSGRTPAVNARVSLIPSVFNYKRPFTVPLQMDYKTHRLVREVRTDKDGVFALPPTAAGEYRLQIQLNRGQTVMTDAFSVTEPNEADLSPPTKPRIDLGRTTIEEGLDIEVFVRNDAGDPLQDALVSATQGRFVEAAAGDMHLFRAKTDHDGVGVLRGLERDRRTSFQCSADGFEPSTTKAFDVPPLAWECVLRRHASIFGTILTHDGYPLFNAVVSLNGEISAKANTSGEFSIADLKPGKYDLVIGAQGYESHRVACVLEPGESRRLPVIRLAEGTQFYGFVVDGQLRSPIVGATITSLVPPGLVRGTTGRDGRFAVAGGHDYELEVAADGYVSVHLSGETLGNSSEDDPAEVTLWKGGRIRVLAWDDQTGGHCNGCSVVIVPIGSSSWQGDTLVTNSGGEAISKALPAARYGVGLERVRTFGSVVTVSGGDLKGANVLPGETVSIELGRPRKTLLIYPVPPLPPSWRIRFISQRENQVLTPNAAGVFTFLRSLDQPYVIALVDTTSSVQVNLSKLPREDDRAELILPIPQTFVHGIVQNQGAPNDVYITSTTDAYNAVTTTTKGGWFGVPHLPPGSYEVMIDRQPTTTFLLRDHETLDLRILRTP